MLVLMVMISLAAGLRRPTAAVSLRGGKAVVEPHDEASFDEALGASAIVVVDFSASWCGPCRMIAPAVAQLASQMDDVTFVKVDVDEVPEAAQKYAVSALPTFVFFRDGVEIHRFSGASVDKLRTTLADTGAVLPSNDIF